MDAVAAKAKVAKGTLYLYFQTKDDLLAGLAAATLTPWAHDLAARLQPLADPGARELARVLMQSFAAHPLALQLLPFLRSGEAFQSMSNLIPGLDPEPTTRLWRAISALSVLDAAEFEEALANQIRGAVRGQKNRKRER